MRPRAGAGRARTGGAFVNLEPLVGALVGWCAFSDPVGPWQLLGAIAVISGILISLLPRDFNLAARRGARARARRAAILTADTLID